eukprot:COSAG02_NODE_89_length_38500_cov_61.646910_2_plen_263_part_00
MLLVAGDLASNRSSAACRTQRGRKESHKLETIGSCVDSAMTKAWAWLLCTCTASCIVPSATAQQDLSLVGAVADDDAGCSLGYYDHDEDASTACLACPVGKYSRSPAAISRPELDAGAGELTLSVDNGDSQRLFAMGDPSSNPHPDGGWNYATTNCSFDACIAECTCAADCEQLDGLCNWPPMIYAQPDFAGMNGIRRCGATSQSTVTMVSACNPSSFSFAVNALTIRCYAREGSPVGELMGSRRVGILRLGPKDFTCPRHA